jgi:hypothetical protein
LETATRWLMEDHHGYGRSEELGQGDFRLDCIADFSDRWA